MAPKNHTNIYAIMMNVFRKHIEHFNSQLSYEGLVPARFNALKNHSYDGIIFLGIGGSALPAEIIKGTAKEISLRVPMIIWKEYGLPTLPKNILRPLYICVSFSGNTPEPLSGLITLLRTKNKKLKGGIVVVTSNSSLVKPKNNALFTLAENHQIPSITFESGTLEPREGLGRMFYSVAEILYTARLVPKRVPTFTMLRPETFRDKAKRFAIPLKNHLIVIYTTDRNAFMGYLWKIRFNENAKTPAFANVLPEMDHNELVGFEKKRFPTTAIFLEDPQTPKTLKKQWDITERLLSRYGVGILRFPLHGTTLLEKTWRGVLCADWTSYFLAEAYGVNPAETESINALKSQLKK